MNTRSRFPATLKNESPELSSFEESSEDIEGENGKMIAPRVIVARLSQPDETAFSRIRNSKRGRHKPAVQILVVRFSIKFQVQVSPSSELSITHDFSL
jgi:hypothetical protein